MPMDSSRVCSDHFRLDDFESVSEGKIVRLKPGVIPSIFTVQDFDKEVRERDSHNVPRKVEESHTHTWSAVGSKSPQLSKPFEEEFDIKLAQTIIDHLGLSGNTSFDMLAKENQATVGSRLELILGIVANGALVSLINSILNDSDVEDLASMKGILTPESYVQSHLSKPSNIPYIKEPLEDMLSSTEVGYSSGDANATPQCQNVEMESKTQPLPTYNTVDQELIKMTSSREDTLKDTSSTTMTSDSKCHDLQQPQRRSLRLKTKEKSIDNAGNQENSEKGDGDDRNIENEEKTDKQCLEPSASNASVGIFQGKRNPHAKDWTPANSFSTTFTCHFCNEQFRKDYKLKLHLMLNHKSERPEDMAKAKEELTKSKLDGCLYKCAMCGSSYNSVANFTRHIKDMHEMSRAQYREEYGSAEILSGTFKCELCEKV